MCWNLERALGIATDVFFGLIVDSVFQRFVFMFSSFSGKYLEVLPKVFVQVCFLSGIFGGL